MKVLFRTDASPIIGTGHLVRCLTLAEELRCHGGDVSFICRTHDGHYCDLVEKHRFCLYKLTSQPATSSVLNINSYGSWLGAPWEIDAAETLKEFRIRLRAHCKTYLKRFQIPVKINLTDNNTHSSRFKKNRQN